MIYYHESQQSGFALLLAVVVSSIVLAIGLTLLNVTVKQLTLSAITRESELAFQAASSGQDCIRYWRLAVPNDFFRTISAGTAPNIRCFAPSVKNLESQAVLTSNGSGAYVNEFNYQFDWGSGVGAHCTEIDLYAISASSTDYTVDFSLGSLGVSNSVGVGGVKTCSAHSLCTIAVSRGYNRACSDVSSASLLIVEREITSEY